MATIEELRKRVGKGTEWLRDNDPGSRFHLWWEAGLTKHSSLPAQDSETVAAWQRYFDARRLWEGLDAQLTKMEPT